MAIYLTAQKKQDIFTEFGGKASNTGGTESQVALMTHRINELSKHLQSNHKDLMQKDIQRYREIIDKLGIRK